MEAKKIEKMWAISLFVIGIGTILLSGANIVSIELPNILVWIVVLVELLALPVLIFSSVKKLKKQIR